MAAKEFLATLGVIAGGYLAYRWVTGLPMLPAPPPAMSAPPQLEVIHGGRPKGDVVPDFEPVRFEADSVAFPAAGHGPAQVFAQWILDHPGWIALVVGHDAQGNQPMRTVSLSKQRAMAVADVLIRHGVPEELVQVDARGLEEPVAPDTEEGRAYNRRVEFVAVQE